MIKIDLSFKEKKLFFSLNDKESEVSLSEKVYLEFFLSNTKLECT